MTGATLLDGGMGTALLDAGLPPGALPESWLVSRPERIARVHAAHASAGARVVLTCTFNLAGARLRDSGVTEPVEELARRAVALARIAAPSARVAGAVGPAAVAGADAEELRERHGRALRALAAAGADLLWTESHWDLGEARAALAAARRTGLPVVTTFTFREQAGLLAAASGEPALDCLEVLALEGATAVGANCCLPGTPLAPLIADAAARLGVPIVAKPSAGLPGAVAPPAAFAAWVAELARAGAGWVGGCCGAGPAHLAACAGALAAA